MKYPRMNAESTCCTPNNATVGAPLPNIQHRRGSMASVLCYIAHADICHYVLDVFFHSDRTVGQTMSAYHSGQVFYLGINSHLLVILVLLCSCCLLHLLDKNNNSFSQLIRFRFLSSSAVYLRSKELESVKMSE